ncbi:MAG: alpha/beta hydrolase, partial [Synergistaceae bacterium]|nr:alpha/beta hydrolase [Synergistaceae bacterium]
WVNAFNGIGNDPNILKDISVPTQIIWGTEDVFFSKADQLDLIDMLGSEYILFQTKIGYSHNTHWDGHLDEEVAADIMNFIGEY